MTTDPFLKKQPTKLKTSTTSTQNIKKVKKGKKLGMGTFLLGCAFFGIIFLFVIIGGLFYLAKNPQVLLSGNSTNLEGPKQTLKIFGAFIFGFLILISFFFTIFNLIKLFSSKTGKAKYLLGTVIGAFLLLLGTAAGGFYYNLVKKIPSDYRIKNVSLLTAEIQTKDGTVPIEQLNGFIFAPIYINFYINTTKLDPSAVSVSFNCGNGQADFIWNRTNQRLKPLQLLGTCFYTKKGDYKLTYTITYLKNGEKITKQFDAPILRIISQINLDINGQKNNNFKLNDFKTIIIGGNAPVKVIADASDVFNNYATLLADGRIGWDFDGDGQFDVENKEKAYFIYKQKGTYTIFVNFPQIEQTFKIASIRVNESDVPDCSLDIKPISTKKFKINLSLSDPTLTIQRIQGKIINPLDGTKAGILKPITQTSLVGIVKNPGTYLAKINLYLSNGKTISCEKIFKLQKTFEQLPALIYIAKSPDQPYQLYKKISLTKDKTINIDLPYKVNYVKFVVNPPEKENIAQFMLLDEDGNPVNQPEDGKFIFTVKNPTEYTLNITYKNGDTDKFKIQFTPKPPKISGHLKIFPNTGFSPLKVILDATDIKLEDPDDEVIYYTWDFGDGQRYENISQGKVPHEYKFDYEKNNGIFYPKVIVTTKKGLTLTLTGKVIVKQPPRKVKIITEPASQIVKVGEKITFYLQTDGQIKAIHWDFGDGNSYSCQGRQCASISTSYDEPGLYTVKAIVDFYDYPSEIATIKVKVVNDE